MTKETKVSCDSCKAEIDSTSFSAEYYLTLGNTRKPNRVGACYAMELKPPLSNEKHFCRLECLKNWINDVLK